MESLSERPNRCSIDLLSDYVIPLTLMYTGKQRD